MEGIHKQMFPQVMRRGDQIMMQARLELFLCFFGTAIINMQHLNSSETLTWFDCLCTCMFRRPLRAEYPWWVIEDASIWSSSTRWDSKPRGGHSKDRILYCVIRALTALSERHWLSFIFYRGKPFVLNKGWSWSQQQLSPVWVQKAELQLETKTFVWEEHVCSDIYCLRLWVCSLNSQNTYSALTYTHCSKRPCVSAPIIMWFVAVFQKYSLFGSA